MTDETKPEEACAQASPPAGSPATDAPPNEAIADEGADALAPDATDATQDRGPAIKPRPVFERTVGNLTVAVTGATGFVGRHICRTLLEHGHAVRALVRDSKHAGHLPKSAQMVRGDIFDRDSLDRLVDKADACIHLVGIIMQRPRLDITFQRLHVEATTNIVAACEAAGVLRYVHMSALGARPDARANYHRTKFEAEQIVRKSRLPWTIFRPSLIHGPDGEFTEMVAKWVRGTAPPFLFIPYFGAGPLGRGPRRLIQPVFINDLAEAFARSIETERTVREVYPIGGPDRMTWPEMFLTFRDAISPGSKKPAMAIPAWKARAMATVAVGLSLDGLLPFNVDQVVMSQEDSICDTQRVMQHLGLAPTSFQSAVDQYASRL